MKQIKRLQIGKNGLTDALIEQIKSIFKSEKMIRVSILKSARKNKSDAEAIAEKLIDVLGPKYGYKLVGYVLTITKYRKDQR